MADLGDGRAPALVPASVDRIALAALAQANSTGARRGSTHRRNRRPQTAATDHGADATGESSSGRQHTVQPRHRPSGQGQTVGRRFAAYS